MSTETLRYRHWAYLAIAGLAGAACSGGARDAGAGGAVGAAGGAVESDAHVMGSAGCAGAAAGADAPALATDLPFARGGTRLEARHFVADGAEQFRGLFDTQLNTACEFARDESGDGFHCIPAQRIDELIYLDAQCTEPAARGAWQPTPEQPGDLRSAPSPADACPGDLPPYRASYRLAETVFPGGFDAEPPMVYAPKNGHCEVTAAFTNRYRYPLWRLESVPATQLVAARLMNVPVSGGLVVRRIVASDGTQLSIGVTARDAAPCGLIDDGRCVQEPIADASGDIYGDYLDSTCQHYALSSRWPSRCGAPRFGVTVSDARVHVNQLLATRSVFSSNPHLDPASQMLDHYTYTCDPTEPSIDVFALGPEIDMGLPQALRVRTGRGSLHLWRFAAVAAAGASSSDLVPLDLGGDFVDDADHACEVHEAVDGTWRCVPKRSVVTEAAYFQDPGCTTRLRLADDASVPSSELLLLEYGTQQARLAGLLSLVPYTGQLYGVDQTQCVPVSSASPQPLLAQDKAIPLTALASLQSVVL